MSFLAQLFCFIALFIIETALVDKIYFIKTTLEFVGGFKLFLNDVMDCFVAMAHRLVPFSALVYGPGRIVFLISVIASSVHHFSA